MNLQQSKQLIKSAKTDWEQGKIEAAIQALERAIALVSEQPAWVFNRLGQGYFRTGSWHKAISSYEKFLELKPNNFKINLKLAKCYENLSDKELAISYYQRAIEIEPEHPSAHFDLGNLWVEGGNLERAIACWETAIKVAPDGKGLVYKQLLDSIAKPDIDKEIDRYRKLTTENPDLAGFQILLGDLLQADREWEEALDCYYRAKDLGVVKPWLYRRLENVLVDLGRLDRAETLLQELIRQYPDRSFGLEGLARVAMRSQQFDLALQRWQEVIKYFPETIAAYMGKANALRRIGKIAAATRELEQVAANYPDSPQGLQGLAKLATQQQEWQSALDAWDRCIARFPDLNWFKLERAKILIQLERSIEAKPIFQQIIDEFPDRPEGYEGLAIANRLTGDLKSALKYCDYLQQNFPDFVGGYKQQEEILIDMGKFREASLAYLNRPTKTKPHSYKQPKPADFPEDLVLPELVGVGNDYSFIEEKVKQFVASQQPYTLPVSIVIPVYNRAEMLAKTLAALTHQTYPQNLIEVVVVDDGSSDGVDAIIRKYENYLNLIYIRQPNRGDRMAEARNLATRSARHDYLITIDCNILPYPKLVEAFMKFFHVSDRIILNGHWRYASTESITDNEILEDINVALDFKSVMSSNGSAIAKNSQWSFSGFTTQNEAHPRKAIQEVGEYDREFQDRGAEDNEMGYRFYNAGYYFISVMEAMSIYQELLHDGNETNRQAEKDITSLQLAEKCPAPIYRQYERGKIYQVPKVSIYIPAYNCESYIKQAIDSALNQTYTDLEIVICNDGSTDNTLKILEANYTDNPRVRWVSQPNGGIARASNTAVRMCRGMYIGQLDADDLLKPNAVELAVNYLDNNDVGYVYSSTEIIDRAGNCFRTMESNLQFSRETLLMKMIVTHFRMYRKRDWCRTSGFDEEVSSVEDYDLVLKMSEVCHFHHLASANYCYRWHGENISLKGRREQELKHLLSVNKALARMGLSEEWEAVSANITNTRDIKLIRK